MSPQTQNRSHRQKIIIDTDPGIDDAMAMHFAFADPRLEVVGLTTVFGNVFVEQATRNALFLVKQAAYSADVAGGASHPLTMAMNPPSHHVHGPEGLGALAAVTPSGTADPRPAHIYLSETCRAHSGEIILCPVGPLTNIAALLDYDPEITKHVKKVVIMGGTVFHRGNVTPFAEANVWNDPHAADKVFAADWLVEMIGLDVTQQITCDAADFTGVSAAAPEIGGFLTDISAFYMDFYEGVLGQHACLIHDPAAVIAITDPHYFNFDEIPLRVIADGEEVGATIRDDALGRRPVRVATAVDSEGVRKTFLDICKETDRMKKSRIAAAS